MQFAVDIGNTAITFGVTRQTRVLVSDELEVKANLRKQFTTAVRRLKRKYPKLQETIVCSVAPKTLKIVQAVLKREFARVTVVGKDIKVPLKNKYKKAKEVGQDRLVGAYAVKELYGHPAIIIDLGTAITFDVISAKGEYEGGMIVPGIKMSTESLFREAALLPNIRKIERPKQIIGKSTKESILSGIFYGYGAMCSGLIDQIHKKMKRKPKVIVTGGFAQLMRQFISKKVHRIDQQLVLKGLSLLKLPS